jgi:hypothetical protein
MLTLVSVGRYSHLSLKGSLAFQQYFVAMACRAHTIHAPLLNGDKCCRSYLVMKRFISTHCQSFLVQLHHFVVRKEKLIRAFLTKVNHNPSACAKFEQVAKKRS